MTSGGQLLGYQHLHGIGTKWTKGFVIGNIFVQLNQRAKDEH